MRGHISSLRTEKPKEIKTTLKDANQKHFDPRTGVVQQGPSEMGVVARQKSASPFSTASNMSMMNNNDSLAGSILTLGSRPDLLASNMEIYDSASTDLNRLGELNGSLNQLSYQTLSNSNLALTTPQDADFLANPQQSAVAPVKNSIGVNTGRSLTPNKSILQRTKSDSLRKALFASTPALDKTSLSWNNTPNANVQQSNHNNNNKSVTFMGLANSFQALAPIIMSPNLNINNTSNNNNNTNQTSQTQNPYQSQPPQYNYNNNHNNSNNLNNNPTKSPYYDSPVKDSAYGSSEITNDVYNSYQRTSSNGKLNGNTSSPIRQNTLTSTVRTQSSQQQRTYTGAMTSSMKDTAYDRAIVNNSRRK